MIGTPEWMADAACAHMDGDPFFPGQGEDTAPAKAVCAGCPVQEACLDYALTNRERFGVWGGLSERERKKVRRAQRRVPEHGTAERYWSRTAACRCELCTAAYVEYRRRRRAS